MTRFGISSAIFSLKCVLAALLALYIALSIDLPRPYWAVTTAFIIAQPLAGAVLSKGVFRVFGTIFGAIAAIIMVPNLANAPELLILAFALWVGICVFVSALDRTPRSYMFVLMGYSACIIGLPSVDAPGAIFDVASLRMQEIIIGIACGSLVHGVILPGSVVDVLLRRIDEMLLDAERWSRDSISGLDIPGLDAERRRLALDITELHQLSIHLPFETARTAPSVRMVRALQDQLSLILPLTVAVEDRIRALIAGGAALPSAITVLLGDCCSWLAEPDMETTERHEQVEILRGRAAALEPETTMGMGWEAALRLSLLARLASLIAAHRDCRDLYDQMANHGQQPLSARVAALLAVRSKRVLHRDYGSALRAAFGAGLTIIVGCALWIGSGWRDGSTAAVTAGVFLALFASSDDPIGPLRSFIIGTTAAVIIGGFYGFVILPRVDGFPMLAATLAPGLLIGGGLMASPRYALIAVSAMLGLASPALLSTHYNSNFADYANSGIAQIVGMVLALAMALLFQSAGLDGAIRRTLKAGWADIAGRASLGTRPDESAWISRMLDRIGLLVPRLAARGDDPGKPLYDALRDLRTGMVISELRQLRLDLPQNEGAAITPVLQDIRAYYTQLDPDRANVPAPAMLQRIDHAMEQLVGNASASARRTGILALVSLRRNLFPNAPA
jgi:uncharacterized membrane protein YccC